VTTGIRPNLTAIIRWRLAVPTILFMFLSSLDRVNIGFAALRMNADLGLNDTEYGFAAGILFLGYIAGQFPSVLLLQRIGFARWIMGVGLVWGIAAAGLGLVENKYQLYALRVMIGLGEGGLASGIVLYLSQFATSRERAATFALPMLAIPLSVILGGPISGLLLEAQLGGLASWRWMFLIEGGATILVAILARFWFPDEPARAAWLTEAERAWLEASNAHRLSASAARNDWSIALKPFVWASALVWFLLLSGAYGIMFWLPKIVQQLTGLDPFEIGLIAALPWIGNIAGVWFGSASSDRRQERFWHIALPAAVGAAALFLTLAVSPGVVMLALLVVAGTALGAAQGAFWGMPTTVFSRATMTVGVVTINLFGSLGGVVTPQLIGLVRQAGAPVAGPTLVIGAMLLAAGLVTLGLRRAIGEASQP